MCMYMYISIYLYVCVCVKAYISMYTYTCHSHFIFHFVSIFGCLHGSDCRVLLLAREKPMIPAQAWLVEDACNHRWSWHHMHAITYEKVRQNY